MKEYVIMADSTCDLTKEYREKYGITVLAGHVNTPDGKEYDVMPDWDENFTQQSFYSALKKNPAGFQTAPPSVGECAAAMEEAVKAGKGVIMLTISSGMSGAFSFANNGAKMVKEKYPDAEIALVDSLRFGPGFGLMCCYAGMLQKEGKSMEEVVAWLEENKNRFHQAGWLDDLSFVAKKGRLTHAKAFFGTLAGVKPIGEFDYNGMTTVLAKAAGAKAAYAALLVYIEKTGENLEDQVIFIAQTDRMKQAEMYKQMLIDKFHPKAVEIVDVHISCGVNVGPGLMAAYYMGRPITHGLEEEKAILEAALNKK